MENKKIIKVPSDILLKMKKLWEDNHKKMKEKHEEIHKIWMKGREAYKKELRLGTDNDPESLFILGYLSGYHHCEKELKDKIK